MSLPFFSKPCFLFCEILCTSLPSASLWLSLNLRFLFDMMISGCWMVIFCLEMISRSLIFFDLSRWSKDQIISFFWHDDHQIWFVIFVCDDDLCILNGYFFCLEMIFRSLIFLIWDDDLKIGTIFLLTCWSSYVICGFSFEMLILGSDQFCFDRVIFESDVWALIRDDDLRIRSIFASTWWPMDLICLFQISTWYVFVSTRWS